MAVPQRGHRRACPRQSRRPATRLAPAGRRGPGVPDAPPLRQCPAVPLASPARITAGARRLTLIETREMRHRPVASRLLAPRSRIGAESTGNRPASIGMIDNDAVLRDPHESRFPSDIEPENRLARVPGCGPGGRGFESRRSPQRVTQAGGPLCEGCAPDDQDRATRPGPHIAANRRAERSFGGSPSHPCRTGRGDRAARASRAQYK
jgi:hypothetical protein